MDLALKELTVQRRRRCRTDNLTEYDDHKIYQVQRQHGREYSSREKIKEDSMEIGL